MQHKAQLIRQHFKSQGGFGVGECNFQDRWNLIINIIKCFPPQGISGMSKYCPRMFLSQSVDIITRKQEHTFNDSQLGGYANHDFVKIDKIINEAIEHMTKQLQTFDQFIQQKKGLLSYVKAEQFIQYITDDRIFEEAHNHMINRLMHYKNLPNNEKIYYLTSSIQDFNQYFQQANEAKQKIQDFIDKSQVQKQDQVSVGDLNAQLQDQGHQMGLPNPEEFKASDLLNSNGVLNGQSHGSGKNSSDEEDKDGRDPKRKYLKKKHWPIHIDVQFPGIDDPLKLSLQSTIKVKQLKQLIKERANAEHNPDQYQLQISGGEILKKSQITLDDCGLKDGQTILVEILDRAIPSTTPRIKRPSKEEPKHRIQFTLRQDIQDDELKVEPLQGQVETHKYIRLKQLKKMIQDELGIQDKVNIKMYLNDQELTDDKLTIDDSKILEEGHGQIQVEVLIKVQVEVFGKGKDYTTTVEVQPTSSVEVLKQKVGFMKTFINRKHSLLIIFNLY